MCQRCHIAAPLLYRQDYFNAIPTPLIVGSAEQFETHSKAVNELRRSGQRLNWHRKHKRFSIEVGAVSANEWPVASLKRDRLAGKSFEMRSGRTLKKAFEDRQF
jgi:hypothetical protein